MKSIISVSLIGAMAFLAASCAPAATEDELTAMCKNLVGLRSSGALPTEEVLLAKVEEDFKAREKKLLDWKTKDLAGWDKELEAKLVATETDEAKAVLRDEYELKKKVTAEQFEPDIAKLGPDKKAAVEEAKKNVARAKADRAAEVKKCLEEAKGEGVNQTTAKCRAEAETTDKYWNFCR